MFELSCREGEMNDCVRCGICCYKKTKPFHWLKAGNLLNINELVLVLNVRKALKDEPDIKKVKYCQMYYVYNNQPTCLIEQLFGYDKKPRGCKEYPDKQLCYYYRIQQEKELRKMEAK